MSRCVIGNTDDMDASGEMVSHYFHWIRMHKVPQRNRAVASPERWVHALIECRAPQTPLSALTYDAAGGKHHPRAERPCVVVPTARVYHNGTVATADMVGASLSMATRHAILTSEW